MQRRHHRRKSACHTSLLPSNTWCQKRRRCQTSRGPCHQLGSLVRVLIVVLVSIASLGDGLPMIARLNRGSAPGKTGEKRDDQFYHLLANRGMFGGDVNGGIGMKDGGDFDFSSDPMRHFTHWPLGVVHYVVDPTAEAARPLIRAAMLEMTKKTCIKFRKRRSVDGGIKNFLRITANDPLGGCWSSVGMDTRKHQTMNLERPTCWDKGVILHELMHTIGFYHEHQRPDRDNYINIIYENVQDEIEPHQFSKLPSHKLMDTGVPYDLDSIMHYDTHAFGKQGKDGRQLPTIVQKPPHENEMILPIWARPYLSTLDAKEIDVVYRQACAKRDKLDEDDENWESY